MEHRKVVPLGILLLLNILSLSSAALLTIKDGQLEGTVMTTRNNVNYHAFLKIPFAEPPVGFRRFQAPVPNRNWTGTLDATQYGPMCMQNKKHFNVSEDCLHLNVFTKNLGSTSLKPVIVFIHGGSFEEGSALNHRPLYLMDRDIVLVTINYRFGPFGFLSTGTEEAIGNMGLKDQSLALKWVQNNIDAFGGDPSRVTIAGLSAGAYSVTALMASEMSRDLFRRVIAVSGSITTLTKWDDNDLDTAIYLAEQVNCTTSNITQMVNCLKQIPAERLLAVDVSASKSCRYKLIWRPVIEKDFGQERFFTKSPDEVFSNPKLSPKSVMIGITQDEMAYLVPFVLRDEKTLLQLKENTTSFLADCFHYEKYSKDSEAIRTVYLPFDDVDHRSFSGLANLFGDGSIAYGVHRLVRMISNCMDVYYYKFSYSGSHSVFNYPRNSPYGVAHADDLQYVLNTWYIAPDASLTDPENLMIERMTRIWEQFAMKGNPNNSSDPYLANMVWPKHDEDDYYLDIGTHMVEKQGLFPERFKAFDDLISSSMKVKVASFSLLFTLIFITKLI
ncbi:carboxylic ester hydrolase-like [Chironomus tepperi]|uniref:carboxylic ester hydrolase-like n=1 Tax=Chironomus tepperi TaxID=113505 RepID=UPI00391FA02F